MVEEWKWVVGFEGMYEVSNTGKVRSVDRLIQHNTYKDEAKAKLQVNYGKEIKQYINNMGKGYTYVTLWQHSHHYKRFVHRLVAEAFIPNPKGKPQVNHKDCNPQNNNVENLEWTTAQENINHAIRNHLGDCRKKVVAINDFTGERIEFDSVKSCGAYLNTDRVRVTQALTRLTKSGRKRTVCGYRIEYLENSSGTTIENTPNGGSE